jgi:hypothetical protein
VGKGGREYERIAASPEASGRRQAAHGISADSVRPEMYKATCEVEINLMIRKSKRKRSEPPGTTADQSDCEERREALLDEALAESFPASDPPSIARPPAKRC